MSVSRRDFMALVGTAVAGASILSRSSLAASAQTAAPPTDAARWTVQSVGSVRHGAVPITLANQVNGELLVVDACRRGLSSPVASSRHFDLFLANQGEGRKSTPRHHTLAVRALAEHLDRLGIEAPAPVQTMSARLAQHDGLRTVNDDRI
jgi:hypothetical protein